MRRGRFVVRVVLGYGLMAVLAIAGTGCAAVLIGGAVAGGAAAGYCYYKGSAQFDFNAPFNVTWVATLAAVQDLNMPISYQGMEADHGEVQSHAHDGEKIDIYVEQVSSPNGPVTRVHVRVGVFGNQALSQQIHAQISNRLQNPPPVPPPTGPGPGVPVPLGPPVQGGVAPGVTAAPAETIAPPLAGPSEAVVPVSNPTKSGPTAIPVSNPAAKSNTK